MVYEPRGLATACKSSGKGYRLIRRSTTVIQKTQGAVERNDDLVKDSTDYLETREYRGLVQADHNVLRNPRDA